MVTAEWEGDALNPGTLQRSPPSQPSPDDALALSGHKEFFWVPLAVLHPALLQGIMTTACLLATSPRLHHELPGLRIFPHVLSKFRVLHGEYLRHADGLDEWVHAACMYVAISKR